MPLNKSKGNMYNWITHTHSHLGGRCPHRCSYCYVDNPRFGRPDRYRGPLRLIEKELDVKYGIGKTIFIENCNDLFAEATDRNFVWSILSHCMLWPNNIYVFQTKNPIQYSGWDFPINSFLGTTIETNRWIPPEISQAPPPGERKRATMEVRGRKFVTIEPVLDFDVEVLVEWMALIEPEFVVIGADSKGHGLPEPTSDKILALIRGLEREGIEIKQKHNLGRLLGCGR